MLLLEAPIKEGPVLDDRASQDQPGAIPVQSWSGALGFKRIASIERTILQEYEASPCIAYRRPCG